MPTEEILILSRAQDPTESVNLADQHPELVKELLAEAEVILKDAPLQVWILEESQGDFFICSPGSWRHGRRRGSHGPWPIHMGRMVVCTSYAGIWSSEGMKTLSSTEKLCPMSHKSLHWVTLHCEVLTIFSGHSLRTLFGRRFRLLEAQLCPTFCSSSGRFSDDFHKSKK